MVVEKKQSNPVYATYFDSRYLARGLALINSMRRFDLSTNFAVLALDSEVDDYFRTNPIDNLTVITLSELMSFEPRLREIEGQRTRMEFIFTLTPILVSKVLSLNTKASHAIYLDADLYFFEDPELVLQALGNHDVGVIPHNYTKSNQEKLSKFGTYNVGWVAFRNTELGNQCLEYWYSECLEWCFDKPSNGKYADQGYLDNFDTVIPTVKVISSLKFNLAPWNVARGSLSVNEGAVSVDSEPLVFFHFHGVKKFGRFWVTAESTYGTKLNMTSRRHIYRPYLQNVNQISSALASSRVLPQSKPLVRGRGIGAWLGSRLGLLLVVRRLCAGSAIYIREASYDPTK